MAEKTAAANLLGNTADNQAGLKHGEADTGAVTLIQRFGTAANLNIHLHCLVLDGVYRSSEGAPVFHEARAPIGDELQAAGEDHHAHPEGVDRQGHLIEEQRMTYLGGDRGRSRTHASASGLLALQAAPGQWPDPSPGTNSTGLLVSGLSLPHRTGAARRTESAQLAKRA